MGSPRPCPPSAGALVPGLMVWGTWWLWKMPQAAHVFSGLCHFPLSHLCIGVGACPTPQRPQQGVVVDFTIPPNAVTFDAGVFASLECASGFAGTPSPQSAICGANGVWVDGLGNPTPLEAATDCIDSAYARCLTCPPHRRSYRECSSVS